MKTAETEHREGAHENIDLCHDRGEASAGALTTDQGAIPFNPWHTIGKGVGVSACIADEIYPRGPALRILLTPDPNRRPALNYRVAVAVIPRTCNGVLTDGTDYDLGSGSSDIS
jgi:hypothetical protein